MIRFVIRRILLMIPVILGVLLIVFTVNRMSGDPVAAILGADATEEQYEAERVKLGLDKPIYVQFFIYVKGIITKFDLGRSFISKQPVSKEILTRLPISIGLSLVSLTIALILGVTFGVLCAINQNSKVDYIITLIALINCSMPGFWVALMLIIIFAVHLGLLPPSGLGSFRYWILPCTAMALGPIASLTRITRSSMLEVIRQDYISTAKSKGLSKPIIILKHALKNAIFPIITVFGAISSASIGGSVVLETVFQIPGIGSYLTGAISNRDYPAIQSTVFILSLLVCVVNLLVDITYGFVDPRIRAKYANSTAHKKKKKTPVKNPTQEAA